MKMGGDALKQAFHEGVWRAYHGDRLLSMDEILPLIGPNSIDTTLHNTFLVPECSLPMVDPRDEMTLTWKTIVIPEGEGIVLHPGAFILGSVNERFVCDHPIEVVFQTTEFVSLNRHGVKKAYSRKALFAPMYEGRSSCGRLGIASHITAGFGDHGFGGSFTLELNSCFPYPVILHPGMRIGQVAFDEVHAPQVYKGAYSGTNHHSGPVPPKLGPTRF